ncbi:hypothetical protein Tco_1459040 [Tanacetum coccineum]
MPKPQSLLKEPSQENPPTTQSNHDSLQSNSLPLDDNQTQPSPPPSPSREMLIDDINQLQDLSNLLAMHLSQRNTALSPYSPDLPYTLNLNQVEQHVAIVLNVEVKIDDEDAALILLVSLPPSFENFVNSFVVGKDTITLEDVRFSLHFRELRHQASGTSET